MGDPTPLAVAAAVLGPAAPAVGLSLSGLLGWTHPERSVIRVTGGGLLASLLGALALTVSWAVDRTPRDLDLGPWIRMGTYEVPLVFHLDGFAVVFSLLGAGLTALTLRFSTTYLHREPGFLRFFVLLCGFATGVQLVALAGGLDLFFAGWELLGFSSTLFIGFHKDRPEPVRASLRAFATYRACDIGFFLGIVAVHEQLGSTRLSDLPRVASVPEWERAPLAALFLLPALGKSAQLPFSSWLPRAMEGPTPSSALFYGSLSVHAGLYLLLRIHPLLDASLPVAAVGVALGLGTAGYASLVARVQTDAKSTLAFATLAQTGLILAEIAAGFPSFALVHLVGHALLRLAQFLRAPSAVHDAHHRGHAPIRPAGWERLVSPATRAALYLRALHRFRLDERTEAFVAPVWRASVALGRLDDRFRDALSLDRERP